MELPKIKRIAIAREKLMARVAEIGAQITNDYAGKELVLIGVMRGALYFLTDLSRAIDLPVQIDMISLGVYPGSTNRTGAVRITKDLDIDIAGKHVLIVENSVRTGLTIGYLVQNLEARNPESVKICSLFVSPNQQLIHVPIAYFGYEIANTWMVGYGMDVDEKWRNLPFVAEVDKALLKSTKPG